MKRGRDGREREREMGDGLVKLSQKKRREEKRSHYSYIA
jgi:hypothetical protein